MQKDILVDNYFYDITELLNLPLSNFSVGKVIRLFSTFHWLFSILSIISCSCNALQISCQNLHFLFESVYTLMTDSRSQRAHHLVSFFFLLLFF